MQIWPAIDLSGGKCVRLRQGDFSQETVFGGDPVAVARNWVGQGAECIHLVDLDGAKSGIPVNEAVVVAIVREVSVPCELGGGIRDEDTIRRFLKAGLHRLVLGTQAIRQADWFVAMCRHFPQKLVLGIDARNGLVATHGWLQTSQMEALEVAQRFADEPIAAIVYTDIAKDGMMAGPNIAAMTAMKRAVACPVVASGGVTTVDDVARLADAGLDGCIIGRALYEGTISLSEAIKAGRRDFRVASQEFGTAR